MEFVNPTTSQQTASSGSIDNNTNPDDWLDIALGIAGPQDDWFLHMDGGETSLFFTDDKVLSTKVEKMGMNSMGKASLLRSAFSTGDLQSLELPSDFSPRWVPRPSLQHQRLESVPENATSNGGAMHGPPINLPMPQLPRSFHEQSNAPALQHAPQLPQSSNPSDPLSDPLQSLSIEQLEQQLSLAQQQGGMPNTGMPRGGYLGPTEQVPGVGFQPPMQQGVGPMQPPMLAPPTSQAQPSFPQIKQSSSSQDLMALGPMQNGMGQANGGMYGMMPPMGQGNGDANGGMSNLQMPFMMPGQHNSVMTPQAFHAYSALMNPSSGLPSNPNMPPQNQTQPIPNLTQAPHQPLLPPLTAASLQQSPPHPQQHPQAQSQPQLPPTQQPLPNGLHGAPPPSLHPSFSQQPQNSQLSASTTMDFTQAVLPRPGSVNNFASLPAPPHQTNDLSHAPTDQGLSISTAHIPTHQQQFLHSPHQPQLTSPSDPGMNRGLRKSQSCVELASWRSQSSIDLADLVNPTPLAPGKLTPEERAAKLMRYRQKRNERNFNRTIKYQCRKTLADTRPRVRGRFARNNDPDSVPPELTKKALRAKGKGPSTVKAEGVDGLRGVVNPNDFGRVNGLQQNSSSHTTTTSTDESVEIPSLSDPMAMLVDSGASSATSAFSYMNGINGMNSMNGPNTTQMMAPPPHMFQPYAHYMPNQPMS